MKINETFQQQTCSLSETMLQPKHFQLKDIHTEWNFFYQVVAGGNVQWDALLKVNFQAVPFSVPIIALSFVYQVKQLISRSFILNFNLVFILFTQKNTQYFSLIHAECGPCPLYRSRRRPTKSKVKGSPQIQMTPQRESPLAHSESHFQFSKGPFLP